MNLEYDKIWFKSKKIYFWCSIMALLCIILLIIVAFFIAAIHIIFSASEEDLKFMPGRDTIESYQRGRFQILKGDKENTFHLYDNSLNSSSEIIKNIKKWRCITIHSQKYICTIDENNHFFILNMTNGNLLGPLLLEMVPTEFVPTCKSMI
jgi:hypothetical protein